VTAYVTSSMQPRMDLFIFPEEPHFHATNQTTTGQQLGSV
jgi:hypothetical protein